MTVSPTATRYAWPTGGLSEASPDAISKMEAVEVDALVAWLKNLR